MHTVLQSHKAAPLPLPLTVIVGLTPSRLDSLEAQCHSWPGPLHAAVYIALLQPLRPGQAPGTPPLGNDLSAQLEEARQAVQMVHTK